MASILALKLTLLLFLGLVPLVFGLLPIKLVGYLSDKSSTDSRRRRYCATAISVLSCFASGVILGVSLIELFPEARCVIRAGIIIAVILMEKYFREGMESVADAYPILETYPFVELLVGLGLLLVYFVEEFISMVFGVDHHDSTSSASSTGRRGKSTDRAIGAISPSTESLGSIPFGSPHTLPGKRNDPESPIHETTTSSVLSYSDLDTRQEEEDLVAEERRDVEACKAVIGAATLVLAMLIHTILEGFAFGIQKKIVNVGSLFFGIAIHKALVSFSVGMSLIQALSHNRRVAIAAVVMLSTFTPIGGLVGISVEVPKCTLHTYGM